MIIRYQNFTTVCNTIDEARKQIETHKADVNKVSVHFRAIIPWNGFEELVTELEKREGALL
jgi:hypothetical protein